MRIRVIVRKLYNERIIQKDIGNKSYNVSRNIFMLRITISVDIMLVDGYITVRASISPLIDAVVLRQRPIPAAGSYHRKIRVRVPNIHCTVNFIISNEIITNNDDVRRYENETPIFHQVQYYPFATSGQAYYFTHLHDYDMDLCISVARKLIAKCSRRRRSNICLDPA